MFVGSLENLSAGFRNKADYYSKSNQNSTQNNELKRAVKLSNTVELCPMIHKNRSIHQQNKILSVLLVYVSGESPKLQCDTINDLAVFLINNQIGN